MNISKVIKDLEKEYPGKKIIYDKKNPTEVLCEIDPASEHENYSVAIAVIDKTTPHYHKKSAEIYAVLKGDLTLYKNGQPAVIHEGEISIIKPLEVHYAEGDATVVSVYSEPGWNAEDQFTMSEHELKDTKMAPLNIRLSHLHLLVSKFEESIKFYEETLGFELIPSDSSENYAEFRSGNVTLSLFRRSVMEKTLPLPPATVNSNAAVLVLTSDDVDQSYSVLSERKVAFIDKPENNNEWGLRVVHLKDPEGNLIEINSPLK